jgi:hypothetical protein
MRLPARILLLLLVLFGPMASVIGLVAMLPSLQGTVRLLLLCSMIWLMSALLLSPVILFPDWDFPPPPSDGGDGGGGGGGGDDPPKRSPRPSPPRGGIPLPDAEQSRQRVRDHRRPAWRRVSLRRPAREPQHAPRVPHK